MYEVVTSEGVYRFERGKSVERNGHLFWQGAAVVGWAAVDGGETHSGEIRVGCPLILVAAGGHRLVTGPVESWRVVV